MKLPLRLERRRRMVYLLPNLFTSASLFCGLLAIVRAAGGDYTQACYLIIASGVFDALDGPVARITRSASSFGQEYDSLADLVAFGVAPAFLMLQKLNAIGASAELHRWAPNLALGACGLFVICGAIRLARFNIQVAREERKMFTGLPIPGAALVVVSAFLFVETYMAETKMLHRVILLLMIGLSGLMVSTIPFPKAANVMAKQQRNPNALVVMVFAVALVGILWPHLPALLLGSSVLYLGISILLFARSLFKDSAPDAVRDPSTTT
ncbi:MAG: CDP-diacylglycerol--serine O-phosphatidyltransferase [Candidatus Sumerlaeia bacterium]|nr:CDP-diacylglycerol--serine O-phosphatidyltransferase [Candidatus Sumerlaeia bacterium]